MVLKKITVGLVSVLKVFSEILYEVLKKFSIFYYMIFIVGLLISIKNNTVSFEVILVSIAFLIMSWGYCKFYTRIHDILEKNV
ncbi:MAG: hypothetical protein ACRCXX_00260 [Cetobacterium sp.]|uniref:hypothetical protein n=2 Tax=Cetobacterium sp. TaxID=2071632 RepID=UPI0025CD54A2|nr:hypothetical protein [uncultured Cetobacterium sp.]